MADPVPPINPNQDPAAPPPPPFNNQPYGMAEPSQPNPTPPVPDAPEPAPSPIPEPQPEPAPEVYRGPGTMPDLTVPEPPFPTPTNTPPPNPTDPPVMVRGETNLASAAAPAAGPGVTTATILPVGGGNETISYSSTTSKRRWVLPVVIIALILLLLLAGGFVFFRQSGNSNAPAPAAEVTETPTSEPSPPETTPTEAQVLPTTPYTNNEFSFTLDYPQGWDMKEGVNGNVATFTDLTNTLSPSKVSVHVESTTSDLTTYAQQTQKIYSQLYTGWTNVNTNQTTLGTLQAVEVESTYTKGASNMGVIQQIVISGGKAFTITAEAEETALENLRPTFTQILASLKFSN